MSFVNAASASAIASGPRMSHLRSADSSQTLDASRVARCSATGIAEVRRPGPALPVGPLVGQLALGGIERRLLQLGVDIRQQPPCVGWERLTGERLLEQLGQLAQLDPLAVARRLDRVLVHRHVLGAGDDEEVELAEADAPRGCGSPTGRSAPGSSGIQIRPPPAPQQNELSRLRGISTSSQPSSSRIAPRRVVAAVVAAEVARVVVGDAVGEPAGARRSRPASISSSSSVGVVERPSTSPPSSRVLVAQRVERVRVAGHDAVELAVLRASRRSARRAPRTGPPRRRGARRCRSCARRRRGSRSRRRPPCRAARAPA